MESEGDTIIKEDLIVDRKRWHMKYTKLENNNQKNMKEKRRVKYIDMVKGITILCIALYHIVAPGIIRNVLAGICAVMFFSFFFYSGYLYTPGKDKVKRSIGKRAKGLLLPFVKYSIPLWATGSVVLILQGKETIVDALCCLRNFFVGSIWNRTIQDWFEWDYHHLGKYYPFLADFWFLLALFLASVLFIILREKICKSIKTILITIAIMLFITGLLRGFSISLPYNLQLIPFWTAIILMGNVFREGNVLGKLKGLSAWIFGIVVSVLGIGISVYLGWGKNLFRGEFDNPEVVTMIVLFCLGIVTTWGISVLCKQMEDSGINISKIAYIGSHSIFIYMYHYFIAWLISMFTGFSIRYDENNVTASTLSISIVLAIVSIALSILIALGADILKKKKLA